MREKKSMNSMKKNQYIVWYVFWPLYAYTFPATLDKEYVYGLILMYKWRSKWTLFYTFNNLIEHNLLIKLGQKLAREGRSFVIYRIHEIPWSNECWNLVLIHQKHFRNQHGVTDYDKKNVWNVMKFHSTCQKTKEPEFKTVSQTWYLLIY